MFYNKKNVFMYHKFKFIFDPLSIPYIYHNHSKSNIVDRLALAIHSVQRYMYYIILIP